MAFYSERLQESATSGRRKRCARISAAEGIGRIVAIDAASIRRECPRTHRGVAVWHPSVRFYDLLDKTSTSWPLFLDPLFRAEKRSGAWMDECIVVKALPSGTALPVAQLVCNFTGSVGGAALAADARRVITLCFTNLDTACITC